MLSQGKKFIHMRERPSINSRIRFPVDVGARFSFVLFGIFEDFISHFLNTVEMAKGIGIPIGQSETGLIRNRGKAKQ